MRVEAIPAMLRMTGLRVTALSCLTSFDAMINSATASSRAKHQGSEQKAPSASSACKGGKINRQDEC